MSEITCNVFISHIHEDDTRLGELKDLLASYGCVARDSSVNSETPNRATDPDYIKTGILAPRIQWAGTMIVLISSGTHESTWVNWEIEYAHKIGKRIVGVWDYGAKDSDVPEKLDLYANAVVGWQGERIIDAVFGRINNWQTSTGELRPERDIARFRCK
jgi:hypothetical protein